MAWIALKGWKIERMSRNGRMGKMKTDREREREGERGIQYSSHRDLCLFSVWWLLWWSNASVSVEFHFILQCFKKTHIFLWCNPFSAVYCVHKSRVCSTYTSDYYLNCVLLHILIGVIRSDKMLHTTKSTDRTKSKNQNCISFCGVSLIIWWALNIR